MDPLDETLAWAAARIALARVGAARRVVQGRLHHQEHSRRTRMNSECILCGAPGGYPYCSSACEAADNPDESPRPSEAQRQTDTETMTKFRINVVDDDTAELEVISINHLGRMTWLRYTLDQRMVCALRDAMNRQAGHVQMPPLPSPGDASERMYRKLFPTQEQDTNAPVNNGTGRDMALAPGTEGTWRVDRAEETPDSSTP